MGALALVSPAWAQSEEDPPVDESPVEESPLADHRTAFDVLAERTIGTASKPVAFNWRRSEFQLAATGSLLFELNTFNSMRAGLLLRLPSDKTLFEVGVSYAESWNSQASRQIALTPYRQPGRPRRLDLDLALVYPLAEGVVTAAPRFFPAVQVVFNGYAALRYSVYPTGWGGMRPGQVVGAIFNPRLTEIELGNLERERLDAMAVDTGRYGLLVGFGNDVYFEQGVFVSPRIMVGVPILAPASGTQLLFWADVTLAVGMAF